MSFNQDNIPMFIILEDFENYFNIIDDEKYNNTITNKNTYYELYNLKNNEKTIIQSSYQMGNNFIQCDYDINCILITMQNDIITLEESPFYVVMEDEKNVISLSINEINRYEITNNNNYTDIKNLTNNSIYTLYEDQYYILENNRIENGSVFVTPLINETFTQDDVPFFVIMEQDDSYYNFQNYNNDIYLLTNNNTTQDITIKNINTDFSVNINNENDYLIKGTPKSSTTNHKFGNYIEYNSLITIEFIERTFNQDDMPLYVMMEDINSPITFNDPYNKKLEIILNESSETEIKSDDNKNNIIVKDESPYTISGRPRSILQNHDHIFGNVIENGSIFITIEFILRSFDQSVIPFHTTMEDDNTIIKFTGPSDINYLIICDNENDRKIIKNELTSNFAYINRNTPFKLGNVGGNSNTLEQGSIYITSDGELIIDTDTETEPGTDTETEPGTEPGGGRGDKKYCKPCDKKPCPKPEKYWKYASNTTYSNTSRKQQQGHYIAVAKKVNGKTTYIFNKVNNNAPLVNSLGQFEGQPGGTTGPLRNKLI